MNNTRARASLAIVKAAYREELAKEVRFIAERDGRQKILWPKPLLGKTGDGLLAALKVGQQGILSHGAKPFRVKRIFCANVSNSLIRRLAGWARKKQRHSARPV